MNKDQLLRVKQLLIDHREAIFYTVNRYLEGSREDLASKTAKHIKEVDVLINEIDERLNIK